jgi:hypothetical protein
MSAEQRHEEPTRGKGFSRMARQRRRQYGSGCLLKRGRGWAIRWRELEIAPDGTVQKRLRYEALGDVTRKQAAETLAERLAASDHGEDADAIARRVPDPGGRRTWCRCTSTRRRRIIGTS